MPSGELAVTGEFEAIAGITKRLRGPDNDEETWIGDDLAVLPALPGSCVLLGADTVVGGVHADLSLTGLDDLGWKALAAAVSDVAAMGGDPGRAVVSIAAPPGTDLVLLYEGLASSAEHHGCPIVGGDLVSAPSLVVTVSVMASCDGKPVLRSGARPGDRVWVSRPLGASAAGLRAYRSRSDASEALRAAHARPVAEIAAGTAARRAGATAMIDVSDGLSADLGHLADASSVGVVLDSIPVAPGASFEDAIGGGEDYALVFCAPPDAPVEEEFARPGTEAVSMVGRDRSPATAPIPIGICNGEAGVITFQGRRVERVGWQHSW